MEAGLEGGVWGGGIRIPPERDLVKYLVDDHYPFFINVSLKGTGCTPLVSAGMGLPLPSVNLAFEGGSDSIVHVSPVRVTFTLTVFTAFNSS